jgi:hypothetical protein
MRVYAGPCWFLSRPTVPVRPGVAAVYASDGGGINGPCMDAERSAALSRTPVAAAVDGLKNGDAR